MAERGPELSVRSDRPVRPGRPGWLRALLGTPTQGAAWVVVIVFVVVGLLAPVLAPIAPNAQDLRNTMLPPDGAHWLGTDDFGRDQFSRLLYGLRSSLFIGAVTSVGVAIVGIPLGLLAGYARGWLDVVLARLIDIGLALPSLVLALGLIAAMGAGMRSTVVALIAGFSPYMARVVRSLVLQLREQDYVDSARVTGVPAWRILTRHVLPNTMSVVLVQITLIFSFAVVGEAGLSFVGLGVQPPSASLGNLLAGGTDFTIEAPLLAVSPGAVIALLVMAMIFAGDGVRAATDPRRES